MSHIFVSYSRKDIDFADKIVQALADNALDTWIDWKSIPKGEDWEQEIYRGIEEADAFLFLISPDSVVSQMCNKEIAHAAKNGKRILPIVIRDADPKSIHFEISKRNWIFCRDGQDDFGKAIEEIRTTIHTDFEWLKYHTKLQIKALDWDRGKDHSRLLRGKELQEAEQELAELGNQKDPQSTKIQREYVLASRRTEERQRNQFTIGLSLGLIILAVVAIFALIQRNEAQRQSKIALARQLAVQAQSLFTEGDSKQVAAVLLAIQSMRMFPTGEVANIFQNNPLAYPISHMTHGAYVVSVTFSPDGKYVASGGCDQLDSDYQCAQGSARVWEATTGQEISRMTHDDFVFSVAFSPDGRYVVSVSGDNTARVWEVSTGKEISRMAHDGGVDSIAFSPDGRYVVSGGCDQLDSDNRCTQGSARVWEATTGQEIARMTYDDNVSSVAFSPDGKYVVSGSGDNTVRVWEASTGKEISRMTHDGGVDSIAFSPDGRYVVSGSGDNTARVWEASTGKEISRMTHDDAVSSVAFSPDGKYVVSGSWDNTARVWEASTGKEISRMTHDVGVLSVAFSPDGKYVVSGSGDNTVRVWIYRPDDLIADACFRVTRNLTRAEWDQYIGDALPYQAVCPNLPIEPESTPTTTP